MAARKLGLETVPCIRLADLTEAQKKAYIIADNKLALNAGWDDEMLKVELSELKDLDYDLALTGFDVDDLAALFNQTESDDMDEKEPVDESRNLLLIECVGERELEKLFQEMQERGFECKIMS